MKDIKTKEVTTKPKTKNPASRIPKELMRTAILESKEKSQTIANARDNDMGEQSPSEYASGKVTSAEEWAARKTGRTVTRAGKTAAQTSYEKIKQRAAGKKEAEKETARGTGDTQTANPASREAQEAQIREVQIQEAQRQKVVSDAVKTKEQKIRAARETPRIQNRQEIAEMKQLSIREQSRKKEAKDTVRQTAIRQKQPETIRIKEKPRKQPEPKNIQKRIIKTAPQSAKISVQPEQKLRAASSNALTARMQKQMERRAAKQAAKKAALQTSDGIRRIQKTARAGENTFKAARAAVEVAAKTVQSMMAALGAAGAVIVLLLVIMVGIIGGAAFSGSSESNEALSQEVLSYTTAIQKYANQYGIPEYVSVIQAIMMQESGGRGTDPMQSSECPYNTRYSNSPNAIQDADYSIQVGIQYYADCLKEAGCTSPQDMDKLKLSLQGYNYGNGYITWAIRKYGGYSAENALQFSNEQAASHGWSAYGDPEYVPHVLRYYSSGGLFAGLFGGSGQIVSVALEKYLSGKQMQPYVADLSRMETGTMKRPASVKANSFIDWSGLREQVVLNLPPEVEDPVTQGATSYEFSPNQPAALNLLGCIDTTGASPFLIPVSSYNELLEAAGEKTIVLGIDEAVFYLNPDFQGSTKEETTTMLNQIAEDARANGKVLISIDGLPITLIPFVPMKGLTADENVKIITALIVSDEVYSEYVNPDTVTVYHNFCIPSETVEADGLMVSIMEARDLLKPSGLYCESYLDNFGRQLFYVISGSYTTLYMGFMLLIIACALLALQFLTQMRETKARYATLSILGARREQMKRSINQQVLWYFLLPLFPACISGTVGICAMQHYLYSNMAKLQQSYPMLLVMALVVVCMLALYGVAIARTANREISKLNWKPNA